MKRIFAILATLSVIICSCKEEEKQAEERIISVNAMVADVETFGEKRTYVGTVEESEAITLSFEAGGNVKDIYVKVGDHVSAGQLLARLDKNAAQSAYEASKSTLEQAEDGYNRAKQLHDNGSLPEIKWVEIQTKLVQAQSMEKISRQSLEHCELYSPASGVIGSKDIEIGSNISPFQPVFKLMNIRQLKVKTSIPENEISKINVGKKAEIIVPAVGDEVYPAEVIEKSISANILSHSYEAKCIFTGNHEKLLPGMVCKVSIIKPEESGFVVPAKCVQTTSDGLALWKIINGRAKRCKIQTSKYVADGILVLDGISKGDTIVTEGYQKLFDDAKVSFNKLKTTVNNSESNTLPETEAKQNE